MARAQSLPTPPAVMTTSSVPPQLLGDKPPSGIPATSLVTFSPAHAEMAYFLRLESSDGTIAECYTPCTLALPAGRTRVSVIAPRPFQRDIVLSGKPALVKVSHYSKWRYGVGGLLLGISLAEFIYGAVYFPWNGGGSTTAASTSAAAWAFGAIELTSAITLLALGGKNDVQVIDDPSKLKAANPSNTSLHLASIGGFAMPAGSGLSASFQF